jgi:SAM-dependent methyltransferase
MGERDNGMEITGGWNTPEVAAAQLELARWQLIAPEKCGPFAHFLEAMNALGVKDGSLLDAGCGVGHYGEICTRFYPDIEYHGSDISAPMIAAARTLVPDGSFSVRPFEENIFSDCDTVLVSQVMEMTIAPWESLDKVLRTFKKHLILHRLRLTDGNSHFFVESTYAGHIGQEYLWNLDVVQRYIADRVDALIHGGRWPEVRDHATLWVTR